MKGGGAKDDAGATASAVSKSAAVSKVSVQQRKQQQPKNQEPLLPQQHSDPHASNPQQQQPATAVAVLDPEVVDIESSAATAGSPAAIQGEYSDNSFIYEDNSGSESENAQESASAAAGVVLDAAALPSDFMSRNGDEAGGALLAAAVR